MDTHEMDKHEKGESILQTLKEIREEKETEMAEETKTCSACGKSMPATEEYFYKDKRSKTGLTSWCRACQRAQKQARYLGKSISVQAEIISLDFTAHPDLFNTLADASKAEFRSMDQQVLWIIKSYFNRVQA